jgi:hypothetical protein
MHRFAFAVAVATLASPVAFAQDSAGDVCILTATETIQAPKKPRLFTVRLDCGSEPTEDQRVSAALVAGKSNIADGLQLMVGKGYTLAGASTINSFTGNAILSYFTFVRGAGAAITPIAEEGDDLDDAPTPAVEEFPPTTPTDSATPTP